jgi:8-oxo-dGTP diphosphatase
MQRGKDYIGVAVGAIIYNDAGELLMAKRGRHAKNERGCWEFPGGAVEFGETLADAIVREIQEELGVTITLVQQLFAINHVVRADEQHWVSTPFIARLPAGQTPTIKEPHKCDAIGWFTLDALPSPLALTADLDLEAYRQYVALHKTELLPEQSKFPAVVSHNRVGR